MEKLIDICSKGFLEYTFECITFFNSFPDGKLTLRGVGSANIANVVEINHILKRKINIFRIKQASIRMGSLEICKIDSPVIEICLVCENIIKEHIFENIYNENDFIPYPIYNLLLNWRIHENKKDSIKVNDNDKLINILEIESNENLIKYYIKEGNSKEITNQVSCALGRAGIYLPGNLKDIGQKLSMYDDVLLGLDTNILYNCSISEHLIPFLSLINPKEFVHTPNWILLVVTSAVMHELEEASNIRNKNGTLRKPGRMGYRALQEIMELNQNKGIAGLSIVIVGQFDPVLDTRVELQGLRDDLEKGRIKEIKDKYNGKNSGNIIANARSKEWEIESVKSYKSSSGDMIIRDQFKGFLKQIDFHKGIYFLTADKTNAALSRAEGLHPVYFKPVTRPSEILDSLGQNINIHVALGKLIYEFAVEFGDIYFTCGNTKISIQCDVKGESLDTWLKRELKINNMGCLIENYKGIYGLKEIIKVWNELFEGTQGLDI